MLWFTTYCLYVLTWSGCHAMVVPVFIYCMGHLIWTCRRYVLLWGSIDCIYGLKKVTKNPVKTINRVKFSECSLVKNIHRKVDSWFTCKAIGVYKRLMSHINTKLAECKQKHIFYINKRISLQWFTLWKWKFGL